MILTKLALQGFRNLKQKTFSFEGGHTLLHGANGSGKTSVLESIFLLGFGKSFLRVHRREMVKEGEAGFWVSGDFQGRFGSSLIEARFADALILQLNGQKTSLLEISDYHHPVFFSSSQYTLYIESRQLLRRLIDRFIFGVQPLYLHYILRYNQSLKQKNCLLRKAHFPLHPGELDSWNRVLAESGAQIVHERMDFVDRLNTVISETYDSSLKIRYSPSIEPDTRGSGSAFLTKLQELKDREIRSRQTLAGIQRDNFDFFVGDHRLHHFSSGEKKKFLLLVFFAYIELYRRQRQQPPLLLIDDFEAAVDERNLDFLFSHFPEVQVIATSVHSDSRFSRQIELHKEN